MVCISAIALIYCVLSGTLGQGKLWCSEGPACLEISCWDRFPFVIRFLSYYWGVQDIELISGEQVEWSGQSALFTDSRISKSCHEGSSCCTLRSIENHGQSLLLLQNSRHRFLWINHVWQSVTMACSGRLSSLCASPQGLCLFFRLWEKWPTSFLHAPIALLMQWASFFTVFSVNENELKRTLWNFFKLLFTGWKNHADLSEANLEET